MESGEVTAGCRSGCWRDVRCHLAEFAGAVADTADLSATVLAVLNEYWLP